MDDSSRAADAPPKRPMDYWDTLLSERSRKFYDGTYTWNGGEGFWDEAEVYHRFNDPDDVEGEPPTPGVVMSLAEIMAGGESEEEHVYESGTETLAGKEGICGTAKDEDGEETPCVPQNTRSRSKPSDNDSTAASLSKCPSHLSELQPAHDSPEVLKKPYTRSQHRADVEKIREMEKKTARAKIVTKTKTVTKTVAVPPKGKDKMVGQSKKGVARVVNKKKERRESKEMAAETGDGGGGGGVGRGVAGRRRSARLVRQ